MLAWQVAVSAEKQVYTSKHLCVSSELLALPFAGDWGVDQFQVLQTHGLTPLLFLLSSPDGMRERSKKPKWKGFNQRKKERKTFLTKVLGWNKEVI